jgi:hypothetical protein
VTAPWTFVPRLVVRCAGFPMEPLLALARDDSARAADAALDAQERLTQTHAALGACFRQAVQHARAGGDDSALQRLSKARRMAAMGRTAEARTLCEPIDHAALQTALLSHQDAHAAAELRVAQARAVFAQDLFSARTGLWATFRDPWMQEAVFISNPDAFERTLGPYLAGEQPGPERHARQRKTERRLITYLQRLCAKNDTASFFGPMNYGELGAHEQPAVICRRIPGKARERRAYCSFWMVAALARVMADEPAIRMRLSPALHPMWRLADNRLCRVGGQQELPLTPPTAALLAAADGHRTWQELRSDAVDPAHFDITIERLVERGVLLVEVPLPSTIFDPLRFLIAFVEGLPQEMPQRAVWLDRLRPFAAWTKELTVGGLAQRRKISALIEARFSELTGQPARRNAGMTYADRTPFYEECNGTIEQLSFSRSFADDLGRRLAPALAVSGTYGQLLSRHYQRMARQAFDRLAGGARRLSYGHFVAGVEALAAGGELQMHDAELEAFESRLRRLVEADADRPVVHLDAAMIAPLLRDDPRQGLHISPDLMFDAHDLDALGRGDYKLVLGEVHQFLAMWGSQLLFDRDADEVRRQTQALLAQLPNYRGLATILHTRVHKGLLHESFPGWWIQFLGRPAPGAGKVVALRDLDVVDSGAELHLENRQSSERLVIYNSGDDKLHLWAFAVPRVSTVPVHLPGHTPRIEIGGTIYQRERWEVPAADLPAPAPDEDEFECFLSARRLQRRHGLPRFVFYRVAGESKPLFLDFDNPLLVELFQTTVERDGSVVFSEMLPGPQGLWMRGEDGRYCLEVRGTAFRAPLPAQAVPEPPREVATGLT